MARQHAAEWSVDPNRVGVLGFSAGGHLAAVLDAHAQEDVYPKADPADEKSALPNFAILIYPGGIVHPPNLSEIGEEVKPRSDTPPTILVQAENDPVHVENTTVYFEALKMAGIPAEMHVFAQGGHGYGLRRSALPVTNWPQLVETWLHTIGVEATH
jgi:acetyl esterase/lipase